MSQSSTHNDYKTHQAPNLSVEEEVESVDNIQMLPDSPVKETVDIHALVLDQQRVITLLNERVTLLEASQENHHSLSQRLYEVEKQILDLNDQVHQQAKLDALQQLRDICENTIHSVSNVLHSLSVSEYSDTASTRSTKRDQNRALLKKYTQERQRMASMNKHEHVRLLDRQILELQQKNQ